MKFSTFNLLMDAQENIFVAMSDETLTEFEARTLIDIHTALKKTIEHSDIDINGTHFIFDENTH